jgi:hypothetical protein
MLGAQDPFDARCMPPVRPRHESNRYRSSFDDAAAGCDKKWWVYDTEANLRRTRERAEEQNGTRKAARAEVARELKASPRERL